MTDQDTIALTIQGEAITGFSMLYKRAEDKFAEDLIEELKR